MLLCATSFRRCACCLAVVADLPDEGFSSIEYSDESTDASDSILVHIWEWRQTVDVFQS